MLVQSSMKTENLYRKKRRATAKMVSHFVCGYILKIKMSKGLVPTRNSISSFSKFNLSFIKISYQVG